MSLFWDYVWYGGNEYYKTLNLKTPKGNYYTLIKLKERKMRK